MPKLTVVVVVSGMVCLGLMAGVFFAFSVSVLPGLRGADDRTFVTAVRGMNAAIENGLFGIVFVGAFGFTALASVLLWRSGCRSAAAWAGAAGALYLVVLVLTMAVSVPLNNRLATGGGDLAELRQSFTGVWVPVNHLRTLLSTLAVACLAVAVKG